MKNVIGLVISLFTTVCVFGQDTTGIQRADSTESLTLVELNDKLKKIFSLNIITRNYDPAQDDFIGSFYIVSLLLANADTGECIGGHIYRVEGCNSPENIGNDYPFGESM